MNKKVCMTVVAFVAFIVVCVTSKVDSIKISTQDIKIVKMGEKNV